MAKAKWPHGYNKRKADALLDGLAKGETVKSMVEKLGIHRNQVYRWQVHDVDGFGGRYDVAREHQADVFADDIIEIARDVRHENIAPDAGRVAMDAYKWVSARLKPQTYGDRVTHRLEASKDFVSALETLGRKEEPALIEGEVIDNQS